MLPFRKITIDGEEHLRKYNFDDDDYQIDSSLVIRSADKKGKLVIDFKTGLMDFGYCPFNKGCGVVKKSAEGKHPKVETS